MKSALVWTLTDVVGVSLLAIVAIVSLFFVCITVYDAVMGWKAKRRRTHRQRELK